jgi:hypothetical protein
VGRNELDSGQTPGPRYICRLKIASLAIGLTACGSQAGPETPLPDGNSGQTRDMGNDLLHLVEGRRLVRYTFWQLEVYAVAGPKDSHRKLADPIGGGNGLSENTSGFLLHRDAMPRGASAKTSDRLLIQLSYAETGHVINLQQMLAFAGICWHCQQMSALELSRGP